MVLFELVPVLLFVSCSTSFSSTLLSVLDFVFASLLLLDEPLPLPPPLLPLSSFFGSIFSLSIDFPLVVFVTDETLDVTELLKLLTVFINVFNDKTFVTITLDTFNMLSVITLNPTELHGLFLPY